MTVGHEAVELIYAAGGADRVVVRAGGVDAPDPAGGAIAGARRIEGDPTAEVIIGSEVDLVVRLFDVSIEQLNDAGVTSLIVSGLCGQHGGGTGDGADFEDVYADIELYGHLLGTEAQAAAAVARLRERVAAVEGRAQGEEPMAAVHVYIFGDGFLATSGNQSMPQSQMEALGLDNLFGDVPADYVEGNLEELIARDPEVIILTYGHTDGETFEQARDKLLALPGPRTCERCATTASSRSPLRGRRRARRRSPASRRSPKACPPHDVPPFPAGVRAAQAARVGTATLA